MRFFLLAAILLAAPLSAQTTFRLVDPVLFVDGQRVESAGAPLVQDPFGVLMIGVPGQGVYTVSERPFAGARRAGQFDGRGLYFAAQGRSVRLVSREPLLSLDGPVSAYVAFAPSQTQARGLARLAVADGADGRGRRSVEPPLYPAPRVASGPRLQLDDRPAARYNSRGDGSEVRRLRVELDRVVTDRQRLARERDQLAEQRDQARAARDRYAGIDGHTRPDVTPRADVEALTSERDRLARERDRLARERDQLAAANARGESERQRLADEFASLRQRTEDAQARVGRARRTRSHMTRADQDVDDLRVETDRLRDELWDRDRSLGLLREEMADRGARMPGVSSELVRVREQLAEAVASRDRALAARDAAYAQRDVASRDLGAARSESNALRAERDALGAERDALAFDLDRLARQLGQVRARTSAPAPTSTPTPALMTAPVTVRTQPVGQDGAVAFLPDFDFARIQNPDVIRRRLDEAVYPRWATVGRIEGDILVLFQTDRTGRVVRTAVPAPIGGGLDGLAEEIVREMRFQPTDGQGLRSQVVVRFEL